MYKYVSEKVPWILGFHRVGYGLSHGWFKNYKFTEFNHGVAKYYDIDTAAKEELKTKL